MASRRDPLRHLWWVLMPCSIYFGYVALRHAIIADPLALPGGFDAQPWMYRVHMGLGGLALLGGPVQFLPALLRRGRRAWHRALGRVYVLSSLGSAATAIPLTWRLTAFGVDAQVAFALLSVLWFACTALALQRITKGDVAAHRAFMVRSFALAFAAVTLRLLLRGGATIELFSYTDTYRLAAWLCWIPNLLLAEWWLRRTRRDLVTETKVHAAKAD